MEQTSPLKENRDFRRIYRRGRSGVGRNVVVYTLRNRRPGNRLGVTVGKKLGGAVQRNRAKRIIREAYRLLEPGVRRGYDIVVVSRKRAVFAKMWDVQKEIRKIFREEGVLKP